MKAIQRVKLKDGLVLEIIKDADKGKVTIEVRPLKKGEYL